MFDNFIYGCVLIFFHRAPKLTEKCISFMDKLKQEKCISFMDRGKYSTATCGKIADSGRRQTDEIIVKIFRGLIGS